MFTGIVQQVGAIAAIERRGEGARLTVHAAGGFLAGVALGDSIAVNGCCLTAVELGADRFGADCSKETLALTTLGALAPGARVNLERALTLGTPLGGHLVAGHVDGVGEVVRFVPVHESWELVVRAPRGLAKYFAYKGSVAVNGVSLTVNRIDDTPQGCEFSINIIPHTYEVTTLRSLRPGSRVNLEADLIARYVERMLSLERAG